MRHLHFDVIRATLIVWVFFAHAADWSFKGTLFRDVMLVLSPGLTMCLLGFLSAVLLTNKDGDTGVFLLKRGLRIFIPLYLCHLVIISIQLVLGTLALNQDALLHFLGLSLFFHVFEAADRSSIGAGLWFISAILFLYALLPVLRHLFSLHRAGLILCVAILLCLFLDAALYNSESFFSVVIGFMMGVYQQQRGLPKFDFPMLIVGNFALFGLLYVMTTSEHLMAQRYLLLPCYPLLVYPLLHAAAKHAPAMFKRGCERFSRCSFEFYLLHFYFLFPYWTIWSPQEHPVIAMFIAFFVTFALSALLQPLGQYIIDRLTVWFDLSGKRSAESHAKVQG